MESLEEDVRLLLEAVVLTLVSKVMPDYILHMESLEEDVRLLLEAVGLPQFAQNFPHTHRQKGNFEGKVLWIFCFKICKLQCTVHCTTLKVVSGYFFSLILRAFHEIETMQILFSFT